MEIDLVEAPKIHRDFGNRTEAHREIARRFDKEFFDGSRDTGYGGYKYDGRWQKVVLRMMLHYDLWLGSKVLDVGCAKGFLVADFRSMNIEAYGLDISKYAIDCSAYGFGGAGFNCRVGNAKELPYNDKQFDLAVSINTIHNLEKEDCAKSLRELTRVSKHQYLTVDAYNTEEEKNRMFGWNLTARTIMSCKEWVEFLEENGYTGDYGWFIP